MNYKARNSSISVRLNGIAKEQGFTAARKVVGQRKFDDLQQKEADAWLRKELIKKNWWKVALGVSTIISAIMAVAAFLKN
jgi:hypothetical protein